MRYLDIRIIERTVYQPSLFEPAPEKLYTLVDADTDKPLHDEHGHEYVACSIAEAERLTAVVLMPRLRKMLARKGD